MTVYYVILEKFPEGIFGQHIVDGIYKIRGTWFNVIHDIGLRILKDKNLRSILGVSLSEEVVEENIDTLIDPSVEDILEYVYNRAVRIDDRKYAYDQYFTFHFLPFRDLMEIQIVFRNVSRIRCRLEIWTEGPNKLRDIKLDEYHDHIPVLRKKLYRDELRRMGLVVLADLRKFKTIKDLYDTITIGESRFRIE